MKTLLILVDGMRPEALEGVPEAGEMMRQSACALDAVTVMPSVTLPCHMSLFHSVDPGRHGTTTNTYAPQVRPVNGLCEVLVRAGKKCAFFYNWEPLRDLSRPGSLTFSYFCSGDYLGYASANEKVTRAAIACLKEEDVDFAFIYLGSVDDTGHRYGWMGQEYLEAVRESWKNIARITAALPGYTVVVTADHGGHERNHGTDLPEDMTIPILFRGDSFVPGSKIEGAGILDIAPTVARLLGVEPDREWEGKSLV